MYYHWYVLVCCTSWLLLFTLASLTACDIDSSSVTIFTVSRYAFLLYTKIKIITTSNIMYCLLYTNFCFIRVCILIELTSLNVPLAYHPYPSKRTKVDVLARQYTCTCEGVDEPVYTVSHRFHEYTYDDWIKSFGSLSSIHQSTWS